MNSLYLAFQNAHTISIVQPIIPTIAIILLLLFLPISLKFHLVEIDDFLNIPFCVLCFFTNLFIVVTTDNIAINKNNNVNTLEYVDPSSISELYPL